MVGAESRRSPATGWRYALAISIVLFLVSYLTCLSSGSLLALASATEKCGGPISDPPSSSFVPPTYVCHLADGTSRELVPAAATTWLAVATAVLLACAVGVAISAYRGRLLPEVSPMS